MLHNVDKQLTGKTLFKTSLLYLILIFLWVIFMIFSPLSGTVNEQLTNVAENNLVYILTFIDASLIAFPLSIIMIILALFIETKKPFRALSWAGVITLAPYILFASFAYFSQYSIFLRYLHGGETGDMATAKFLFFNNPESITYFADLLGYVIFGVSAIFIGTKYLYEQGIIKWAGIFLYLIALSAFAGFVGYAFNIPELEAFMMISGILTIPFAATAMLFASAMKAEEV